MKIDWTKVKEGFNYQDVLKAENKEFKKRINDAVSGINRLLASEYGKDETLWNFFVELRRILEGSDKE